MRKDQVVSGDAQRIEQLGWMISLKIIDDKDTELELIQDGYQSVIPQNLQWCHWAADLEGMTGKVLDPACGTGGFLTSAIENIRARDVKGVDDLKTLESTIHGMEFKPLPFMLCVTNLILHDKETK